MKKIVIVLALLASSVLACVTAQDTIRWDSPRYMFNPRVQFTHRPAWNTDTDYWEKIVFEKYAYPCNFWPNGTGSCMSYCATPKEPVTVYGVAIVMDSKDCDTLTNIMMQGTLCQKVSGALTLVDTAPVTNGIDVNRFCASIVGDGVLYEFTRPVYEYYFEHPHVMCDSFYVGFFRPFIHRVDTHIHIYHCWDSINTAINCIDPRLYTSGCSAPNNSSHAIKFHIYPILQPCAPPEMRMANEDELVKVLAWDGDVQDSFLLSVAEYTQPTDSGTIYNLTDTTYTFVDGHRDTLYAARVRVKCTSNEAKCPATDRWSPWSEPVYFYFGPDMPDTTQHTPDDTTTNSLRQVQPGSRELLLTPNPTTGQVTVICGLEFRHIEVRNAAGILVFDEYYSVRDRETLDLKGLPAGQYVVTVETAAGTASKVLTVAR